MPATSSPPNYHSYLLRCWQERDQIAGDEGVWRFSLEDSRSGQRRGFADLDLLVQYLRRALQEDDLSVAPTEE